MDPTTRVAGLRFTDLMPRQAALADKLVVRFGKSVPTYDFGNVVRPVPEQDVSLRIPAVSGLIYTPGSYAKKRAGGGSTVMRAPSGDSNGSG